MIIRRISSGERIPNWTVFTFFTGAFESLVLMADMMLPTKDPLWKKIRKSVLAGD